MAKSFAPTSSWGLTVEATGDQIFSLPQFVGKITTFKDANGNVTGQSGTLRPMLHRVVANTMNMVAMSAQEEIVERMGRDLTIRNKSFKGRFPSFIQNQVKITQWANAKNFPNADVQLTVDTQPTQSNRGGTPLILNVLSGGLLRRPFVGKRVAMPISANTRQGGTFEGKVQTRFRWDRLIALPVGIAIIQNCMDAILN